MQYSTCFGISSSHIQESRPVGTPDIHTSWIPVSRVLTSHIQEGFNPSDIHTCWIPVSRVLTSHIQEGFNPPDIQTSWIPDSRVLTSHIQEGFNPPDIQTSYIPVAPDFSPGEDKGSKKNLDFSPISSPLV
jgi:hypothetical protein